MSDLPEEPLPKINLSKDNLIVSIHNSITQIPENAWNALNRTDHPFTSHAFLKALEDSASIGGDSGWDIGYLIARIGDNGPIVGGLPTYIKYHSYGEYVFDHNWAHAFEQAGGRYYPKLLSAIPFTPVPGPRILTLGDHPQISQILIKSLESLVCSHHLSSAHINFVSAVDKQQLEQAGWMIRKGIQFHWYNQGYDSFDDFLASLSSRKRKNLKKERLSLTEQNVRFHQLTGEDIKPHHWQAFYQFYLSTIDKKWGDAYLKEPFFYLIGQMMAEKILLVMAEKDGEFIAGALNFIDQNTLYGRNWGASQTLPNLHFETCYYQAIDFAITHNLKSVEAGAQGFHKVQRGYLPVYTYSAHWLKDARFTKAIGQFLSQEGRLVDNEIEAIKKVSPYRRITS